VACVYHHDALVDGFTSSLAVIIGVDTYSAGVPPLLYFAGHGVAFDALDNIGPTGYLLPVDAMLDDPATYLSMRALCQALSQLQCRHLLLILDCCFAGAIRWAGTRSVRDRPTSTPLYRPIYDRFI
jgi:hypothetical protein